MILRTIFRMAWVITAFAIAAFVALAVLLALGGVWVGDELKAAAPHDPMLQHGAPVFGIVLFATTVTPALTVLPALIAVVAGEVLRLRSWMYYVPAGGAALAVVPLLAAPQGADLTAIAGEPVHDHLCRGRLRRRLHLLAARRDAGLSLDIQGGDPGLQRQAGGKPRLRRVLRDGLPPGAAALRALFPIREGRNIGQRAVASLEGFTVMLL